MSFSVFVPVRMLCNECVVCRMSMSVWDCGSGGCQQTFPKANSRFEENENVERKKKEKNVKFLFFAVEICARMCAITEIELNVSFRDGSDQRRHANRCTFTIQASRDEIQLRLLFVVAVVVDLFINK